MLAPLGTGAAGGESSGSAKAPVTEKPLEGEVGAETTAVRVQRQPDQPTANESNSSFSQSGPLNLF